MKLMLSWFCLLHLALVCAAGISTRSDNQAAPANLPNRGAKVPESAAGSLNPDRHRPLFARRGQYERQRTHKPKQKAVSATPNDLSPPRKVAPKSPKTNCSQLTQTCLPQSGCCDANASCHCRFFNAICFCRRLNSKTKT